MDAEPRKGLLTAGRLPARGMARTAQSPHHSHTDARQSRFMVSEREAQERQLSYARKRVDSLPVPPASRKAILDFADYCFARGLSTRRVIKYLCTLSTLSRYLRKEFSDVNRADVETLMQTIERSEYAEWTKHDMRVVLKRFFRWLRGGDKYPPEVDWLRSTVHKQRRKLPDDMLTQAEVTRLIAAATGERDRAFISMLYESGCRIGELLNLHVRHVQPHPHGFQITVSGAKGSRRVLLIASAPAITAWLNAHPFPKEPDAPLWPTADHRAEPMGYGAAHKLLTTVARRAGLTKAVNPHNFRHTRATHLATHLTEAQMKEYFGWVQASDMASTYVHLSGRDVDNALLKLNGIAVAEPVNGTEKFAVRPCPMCKLDNPPTNQFCTRCGSVLDEQTAKDLLQRDLDRKHTDGIMDRLIQDEEFRSFVDRKLKELGLASAQQ